MRNEPRTPFVFERALSSAIARAIEEAQDTDEAERQDHIEAALLHDFISGNITLAEYHEQDTRGDTVFPGEVELPSLKHLYHALVRLLDGDTVEARDLTDHEADHFREAVQSGFSPKIILRFFRTGKHESMRPAINIILPKVGDEELIRQNLRAIIGAPEELSDLDRAQLERTF